mgnify:FL=1
MILLEEQLRPLVQAEMSVLVDVLHRPEILFPVNTEARRDCERGGFISKYVTFFQLFIQTSPLSQPHYHDNRPRGTCSGLGAQSQKQSQFVAPTIGFYFFDSEILHCFINRLIKHCEKLLVDREERLCVKVLQTLKEMMTVDCDFGEKVGRVGLIWASPLKVSLIGIRFV